MTTDIVVYSQPKPRNNLASAAGFLRDNSGDIWSISQRSVDVLAADDIKPFEEVPYNGKPIPVWVIDKGGERYHVTQGYSAVKRVNKCVFDAIKKYVMSLSLGTLTAGDEDFFVDHPRVDTEGVTRANVLIVSQGLIVPWGLGIDRVWVPKLSSVGDQQLEFMSALGINPVALTDYSTSNEEFIEMLDIDPSSEQATQIRNSCRFEFVDEPQRPCVVMVSGYKGQKTFANVGGQWGMSSTGSGHADFLGPRDSVYGTWEIAFSISKNPVYNNGKDMSVYSSLDYFADEINKKKDQEKKKPKELSTWQSLVGGKSLSDRDKEQSPPVKVTTYKPKVHQTSYNWNKADKSNGSKPKTDKCPECGSNSIRSYQDYSYCLKCNWYEDSNDESVYTCPFCGADMMTNGMCPKCLYDDEVWSRSQIYSCGKHTDTGIYYTTIGKDHEQLTVTNFIYLCPMCLKEAEIDIADAIRSGINHKTGLVESDKRKVSG